MREDKRTGEEDPEVCGQGVVGGGEELEREFFGLGGDGERGSTAGPSVGGRWGVEGVLCSVWNASRDISHV